MPYFKINAGCLSSFEAIDLPVESRAFLDACYLTIGCCSIEVIDTIVPNLVLIVDEEAKCFDGWERRINHFACFLYGIPVDAISGDAILARRKGSDLFPLSQCDVDVFIGLLSCYERHFKKFYCS